MDENTVAGTSSSPATEGKEYVDTNALPSKNPAAGSVIAPSSNNTNISSSPITHTGEADSNAPVAPPSIPSKENKSSPQPFTMDDPNKIVQPQAPQSQAPSQEFMSQPFTMAQNPDASQPAISATTQSVPGSLSSPDNSTTPAVSPANAGQVSEQAVPPASTNTPAPQSPIQAPSGAPNPKPNFTADGTPSPVPTSDPGSSGIKKRGSHKAVVTGAVAVSIVVLGGVILIAYT